MDTKKNLKSMEGFMQNDTICIHFKHAQNDTFYCLQQNRSMPPRSGQWLALRRKQEMLIGKEYEGHFWGAGHFLVVCYRIVYVFR